jgi:hypothetical protein
MEEFFEQFMEIEDREEKMNKANDKAKDEDLDNFNFDEEINITNDN